MEHGKKSEAGRAYRIGSGALLTATLTSTLALTILAARLTLTPRVANFLMPAAALA
jgi:H+/Cl- antiporter ClcA